MRGIISPFAPETPADRARRWAAEELYGSAGPGDFMPKVRVWRYADAGPGWHGWYVRTYRAALAHLEANPDARVRMNWAGRDLDREGLRAEFRKALRRRVYLKVPRAPGRKEAPDHVRDLERDARALADRLNRRIALHSLATPEARARFAHLLKGD